MLPNKEFTESANSSLVLPQARLYRNLLYKSQHAMPAEKTVSVSFRVTPEFKKLLELAAAREQRSQTNLLEKLLFDHCRQSGIRTADPQPKKKKSNRGED